MFYLIVLRNNNQAYRNGVERSETTAQTQRLANHYNFDVRLATREFRMSACLQ